jgi:hypothetical protein
MAKKPEWVESNPDIYLSDEFYPKNIVKVISEGYFDGSTRIVCKHSVIPVLHLGFL